jgi:8-oxo-dGTP diphosphatase
MIRAAGGVVWRRRPRPGGGPPGRAEPSGSEGIDVVVVRRDRYDDWSLPKGKLHAGEGHKAAALREVREETGLGCELGPKLATIRYDTLLGPKRVKWWAMTPHGEGADALPEPDDPGEVAEVVWLPFEEAWRRVTYGTDREVLRRFVEVITSG